MLTFISRVNPVNERGSQKCRCTRKRDVLLRKRQNENVFTQDKSNVLRLNQDTEYIKIRLMLL